MILGNLKIVHRVVSILLAGSVLGMLASCYQNGIKRNSGGASHPETGLVEKNYQTWVENTKRAAGGGKTITVSEGEYHLTLYLETQAAEQPGGVSVFQTMEKLKEFAGGRAYLAWSGICEIPVGIMKAEDYDTFRNLIIARGLPAPPGAGYEVSYDLLFDHPETGERALVIMIAEKWAHDAATLMREICFCAETNDLYISLNRDPALPSVVSASVGAAFDNYLREYMPESYNDLQERRRLQDIFTRMFSNLKARRELLAMKNDGIEMPDRYKERMATPEELTFSGPRILEHFFLELRYPTYFIEYGRNLLPWTSEQLPAFPLGYEHWEESVAWAKSLDYDNLVRSKVMNFSNALGPVLQPYLDPDHTDYYAHLSGYPSEE